MEEKWGTKLLEDRWRSWFLDSLYKSGNEVRTEEEEEEEKIILQN